MTKIELETIKKLASNELKIESARLADIIEYAERMTINEQDKFQKLDSSSGSEGG